MLDKKILAQLSGDSYQKKTTKDEWIRGVDIVLNAIGDCKDIKIFDDPKTDTQAFSFVLGEFRYFIFRGTEQEQDYFTDLNFSYSCFGENYYYTGFGQAFTGIESEIRKFLKTRKNLKIINAGHSLGGALATIASYEIPGVVKLRSFGSPPVMCDAPKTDNIVDEVHFVNEGDSVPRGPRVAIFLIRKVIGPVLISLSKKYKGVSKFFLMLHSLCVGSEVVLSKYKHFGRLCILPKEGEPYFISSLDEVKGVYKKILENSPKRSISDHYIDEYIKRLET